ncbi:hypothetical protein RBSWK_00115 [Rhodopirellula baltica SWK14]|uniref:Uncharacterized protein n=1 Tax=Rhodopirellula baltica SWK14 TaxID=993516 RepID=L7CSL9_RHOBT|nr:hypothetical protein RBSWK_00115 [Rhodopirellula baltica SWK14]
MAMVNCKWIDSQGKRSTIVFQTSENNVREFKRGVWGRTIQSKHLLHKIV